MLSHSTVAYGADGCTVDSLITIIKKSTAARSRGRRHSSRSVHDLAGFDLVTHCLLVPSSRRDTRHLGVIYCSAQRTDVRPTNGMHGQGTAIAAVAESAFH